MAETQGPYQRMSPESAENPQHAEQQQQPERQKPRHKYKGLLYNFGIAEVVFGGISILLAIVTLIIAAKNQTYIDTWYSSWNNVTHHDVRHYYHSMTWPSQGIWCGAILIVTGIFGIKTKSNPSVSMFNANMALSIITACFMVALMTMSGIAAGTSGWGDNRIKSLIALHVILAILGLPAGIICIIHSAYCCAGVCCNRKAHQGPVTYVAHQHGTYQPQQMVRLANGQYMMVPFQPMSAQNFSQTSMPMIAGAPMYPPTQGGVIMPQTTMPPQAPIVQPTVIYPGGAQQQPLQSGSTMMTPHLPTGHAPTAPQSQPWEATKSQSPPGYTT